MLGPQANRWGPHSGLTLWLRGHGVAIGHASVIAWGDTGGLRSTFQDPQAHPRGPLSAITGVWRGERLVPARTGHLARPHH